MTLADMYPSGLYAPVRSTRSNTLASTEPNRREAATNAGTASSNSGSVAASRSNPANSDNTPSSRPIRSDSRSSPPVLLI